MGWAICHEPLLFPLVNCVAHSHAERGRTIPDPGLVLHGQVCLHGVCGRRRVISIRTRKKKTSQAQGKGSGSVHASQYARPTFPPNLCTTRGPTHLLRQRNVAVCAVVLTACMQGCPYLCCFIHFTLSSCIQECVMAKGALALTQILFMTRLLFSSRSWPGFNYCSTFLCRPTSGAWRS